MCWKATYGRGVGRVIHSCADGLEQSGALCYPECKEGFYGVACVCWETCEEGWIDEGALCRKDGEITTVAKDSYGRGVGEVLGCSAEEEEDAALCYDECKPGYYGVGPVCWQNCPAEESLDGGALCCDNKDTCKDTIMSMSTGLPKAVMEMIMSGGDPAAIIKSIADAVKAAFGFVLPICEVEA